MLGGIALLEIVFDFFDETFLGEYYRYYSDGNCNWHHQSVNMFIFHSAIERNSDLFPPNVKHDMTNDTYVMSPVAKPSM